MSFTPKPLHTFGRHALALGRLFRPAAAGLPEILAGGRRLDRAAAADAARTGGGRLGAVHLEGREDQDVEVLIRIIVLGADLEGGRSRLLDVVAAEADQ